MHNFANILRYAPAILKEDTSGGDISVGDLITHGGVKQPEQAQRINTPVKTPTRAKRKKRFYSGGLDT